jgi:hypothetical protein
VNPPTVGPTYRIGPQSVHNPHSRYRNGMTIGQVAELWRYPVKSLGLESATASRRLLADASRRTKRSALGLITAAAERLSR